MSLETFAAGLPAAPGRVYKDDCMYSFDNAENNALGLDVCMSCFQGFARAPHKDYTAEHYSLRKHPLYVNIVKRRKESPPKQAKLEVVQQDLFESFYKIYVASTRESVSLDESPDSVRLLADKILNANSAEKEDEIKTWEHLIEPCPHSIDLPVSNTRADLSKCSSCDLSENLWLCLECGSVGCGRAQFGSTVQGNSHALAHYETCGHGVAVKLGSLAQDEAHCDCYCYKCNDEVKVPNLVEKLSAYGIDLNSAVKTEKSLVEMNIDQNMNWQFGLDDQFANPVFGAGLTGMQNLGNSCYINSIIQSLFSCDSFSRVFENKLFDMSVDPGDDLPTQMLKIYDGLASGRYSVPSPHKGDDFQLGIRPSSFKNLVGANHLEFRTNRQQDANEFLLYLLDKLEKEVGPEVTRSFKFVTSSKVLCTQCKTAQFALEVTDNMSIPIEDTKVDGEYQKVDLKERFEAIREEEISDYQCDKCNSKTTAIRLVGLSSYPENLIVNVQRIKLENWVPVKMDVPISLPNELDLEDFDEPKLQQGETKGEALFVPDPKAMGDLLAMGFPENRCVKGLFQTGNKEAEAAMEWLFAHMEDPDIDEPVVIGVSKEDVATLVLMGFDEKAAERALEIKKSVDAAVEYLFENPTFVALDLKEELLAEPKHPHYKLKAVVCHKGLSPHTGHYVAFVKRDRWTLFNDEKVVECDASEDMERNGYIYFFSRA